MAQRSLREATLTLRDKTGANTIPIKVGDGNITITQKRPIEIVRNQGRLESAILADSEPIDVSFDVIWEWILAGSTTTVYEAINGLNGWESTNADCEPYSCDMVISFDDCEGTHEDMYLSRLIAEDISFDLKAGRISVTARCLMSSLTEVIGDSDLFHFGFNTFTRGVGVNLFC